jgi:xylan 1,4-beta-xylosidase
MPNARMKEKEMEMGQVEFRCNVSAPAAPFPHFWEHTVGSGHAPLSLRADWQAQMRRSHDELGFRYVRFHALLSDHMGTLVRHHEKLSDSFFNADQIMDFLLSIGMKPFVELSFMPKALASGDTTVFDYAANITPPRDYAEWAALVSRLVSHWVERYGAGEVREWFFEVWNEPNQKEFWTGTQGDYFTLYRSTAEAIKGVDPQLRVGGPATSKNAWVDEFLEFCEKGAVPVDYVSTHHYPGDAFGSETDDTETQLSKSRRSILREQARDTRRRARGKPVYYTEWNTSSNPRDALHDDPYAAAFVTKTVMEMRGLVESYSFWTFTDIFAENYFPSVPFHGGFGLLTLHGVPKPTYRAFELLHHLGTDQLPVDGSHDTVDAWVVRNGPLLTVLLTNHALPRHAIKTEQVRIALSDAPRGYIATVRRIDDTHANARRVWKEMGAPDYPSGAEVKRLQKGSEMVPEPHPCAEVNGNLTLDIALPPHGVAAITLDCGPGRRRGGAQT